MPSASFGRPRRRRTGPGPAARALHEPPGPRTAGESWSTPTAGNSKPEPRTRNAVAAHHPGARHQFPVWTSDGSRIVYRLFGSTVWTPPTAAASRVKCRGARERLPDGGRAGSGLGAWSRASAGNGRGRVPAVVQRGFRAAIADLDPGLRGRGAAVVGRGAGSRTVEPSRASPRSTCAVTRRSSVRGRSPKAAAFSRAGASGREIYYRGGRSLTAVSFDGSRPSR